MLSPGVVVFELEPTEKGAQAVWAGHALPLCSCFVEVYSRCFEEGVEIFPRLVNSLHKARHAEIIV